jgi:hypothetical protein
VEGEGPGASLLYGPDLNMAEAIRVASNAGARPQAGISVHPIRR